MKDMDIRYLGRKFVLSTLLAVLATVFIALKMIEPTQWQWVIMATAVSFVAGSAIGNVVDYANPEYCKPKLKDRIKGLFTRSFLVCIITVIVASALLSKGLIPNSVWFTVCSALAAAYNIGNSLGKL